MSSIEDVERNAWDRVLQLNHGRLSHVPHWIQCTKCDKWRVMNISTSVIKFTKTWKAPPNWQCNRNNTAVNNCTLPVTVPSLCTHSAFAVLVLKTQRKLAAIRAIASNADRSIHIQKLNKVIERYAKVIEADLAKCSTTYRFEASPGINVEDKEHEMKEQSSSISDSSAASCKYRVYTKKAKKKNKKDRSITFRVRIHCTDWLRKNPSEEVLDVRVCCIYSKKETMMDIFERILSFIQKRLRTAHPLSSTFRRTILASWRYVSGGDRSFITFTECISTHNLNKVKILKKPITDFDAQEIQQKGLKLLCMISKDYVERILYTNNAETQTNEKHIIPVIVSFQMYRYGTDSYCKSSVALVIYCSVCPAEDTIKSLFDAIMADAETARNKRGCVWGDGNSFIAGVIDSDSVCTTINAEFRCFEFRVLLTRTRHQHISNAQRSRDHEHIDASHPGECPIYTDKLVYFRATQISKYRDRLFGYRFERAAYTVFCVYSETTTMNQIFDALFLGKTDKISPILSSCPYGEEPSFITFTGGLTEQIKQQPITDFDLLEIQQKGLKLVVFAEGGAIDRILYTHNAQTQTNIIPIDVSLRITLRNVSRSVRLVVYCVYSAEDTMKSVFKAIMSYAKKVHFEQPSSRNLQLCLNGTNYCNLAPGAGVIDSELENKPITSFSIENIQRLALFLIVRVKRQHFVSDTPISCDHLNASHTTDPMDCPIYKAMKQNSEYSQENLHHMLEFTHFKDEYGEKTECKYKDECKAYIRCEQGDHRLSDQCHMTLFRHPPRRRNIELAENMNSLLVHTEETQSHPLYIEGSPYEDEAMDALIAEVITNEFKNDLCVHCGRDEECKHDGHSLLKIVDEKMEHIRHRELAKPLKRHHMLALVLYTGCDCNYDLCKSQREGDYEKWKWFDFCLYRAIQRLSKLETGKFSVFSGLSRVKMDKKSIEAGYFVTYTSTSWRKEVATSFIGKEGMLLQIDEKFKNHGYVYCCDVSWISKFPDECEMLFARSLNNGHSKHFKFKCQVLNETNGIQTVSLSKS